MIGTLFAGRFKIIEELGRGGMGAVYRAEQTALGRQVALKLMHPHLAQAPGAAARFHREARVLAKLHHPRSVEVYDLGEADGMLFIAMEILHGVGLDEVLRDGGPMPAARAGGIAAQVLEALSAAHDLGIVHRDLKPANIFLLAQGRGDADGNDDRVKVLDFGLAFLKEESGEGRITRQGQTAGTPAYMAPEQCRGEEVDGRSDLYALGCTLYEMLTGAPPFGFGEDNGMETMAAQLYRPAERPGIARWDLGIPGAVEDVLMRALSKLPRDRYQTALEMREALTLALAPPVVEERGAGKKLARPEEKLHLPPLTTGVKRVGIAGTGKWAKELWGTLGAVGEVEGVEVAPGADLSSLALLLVAPPEGQSALDQASLFVAQTGAPPVLLCGAEDDLAQMAKAIGAGIFDYVPLPLDAADLSRKVSRALRRRR